MLFKNLTNVICLSFLSCSIITLVVATCEYTHNDDDDTHNGDYTHNDTQDDKHNDDTHDGDTHDDDE